MVFNKYDVDDIVYFLKNNKIYKAKIYSVNILNYYNKDLKRDVYRIKYQVYYDNDDWTELKENEIFSSIKDLYDSFKIVNNGGRN